MTRFADPTATDTLTLPGGCQCPGTPHEADVWVYRTELGDGDEQRAGSFGWSAGGGAYFDWEAARDKLIEIATVRWNVVGEGGAPVPVNVASVRLLDTETRQLMAAAVDTAQEAYRRARSPNPSAAQSVTGSPASGSPNRAQRRHPSTTSSSRSAAGARKTSGSPIPAS